jgi:hypothetical protein
MSAFGSPSLLLAVQQYQKAYDQAIELFSVFEDAEPSELLRLQARLAEECGELLKVARIEWENCGNLGRHLGFLELYLKKNDKVNCHQDIKDILFSDLPAALKSLIAKSADESHIDQRLRDGVMPLVHGGHYDSAIRKSFVILTDRLRRAFGVQDQLDGEDLVNLVFGKGGKIPVALDESKKQAFRNLISGFYGVYRNRYAHNDVEPQLAQVGAIVELANSILAEVEQIANASIKSA